MHPYHHAVSSAQKWGGESGDYIAIHEWFDASKEHLADFRHRALRHHAQGIFECQREFGETITNSAGRVVPVRLIGERHVVEDLGRIPTLADWFREIPARRWMTIDSRPLEDVQNGDEDDGSGGPRGVAVAGVGPAAEPGVERR